MRYFYLTLMLVIFTPYAYSSTGKFQCKIESVLKLSDSGYIVTHGWSANYLNRKFTIDRNNGRVINTTALKVRLSNYDSENQPVVLDQDNFRSITIYKNKNTYSAIEIENRLNDKSMPFFYRTNIGMILTGACQEI